MPSVLKISFSVSSNFLLCFSTGLVKSLFSSNEKLAGICCFPWMRQTQKSFKNSTFEGQKTHTDPGYDIFTSYHISGLSPWRWYKREPICNGNVSLHSSSPTFKILLSTLESHIQANTITKMKWNVCLNMQVGEEESFRNAHILLRQKVGHFIMMTRTWIRTNINPSSEWGISFNTPLTST